MVIIEFFTKEACPKNPKSPKMTEVPCVIYNPVDKQKRDLSPLIKLSGLCVLYIIIHVMPCRMGLCGPDAPYFITYYV